MKRSSRRLASVLGAGSFLFATSLALAQTPGGNPAPQQDRNRSTVREHQPGTNNPAVRKQLRSRPKDGGQTGAAAGAAGVALGRSGAGAGGKKYGPGDGTGNQGAGPRDGSGFGPGDCTQPNGGSGTQRRAGGGGKGRS